MRQVFVSLEVQRDSLYIYKKMELIPVPNSLCVLLVIFLLPTPFLMRQNNQHYTYSMLIHSLEHVQEILSSCSFRPSLFERAPGSLYTKLVSQLVISTIEFQRYFHLFMGPS